MTEPDSEEEQEQEGEEEEFGESESEEREGEEDVELNEIPLVEKYCPDGRISLLQIPRELLLHEVIPFLDFEDVLIVCRTSTLLYDLASQDCIWRPFVPILGEDAIDVRAKFINGRRRFWSSRYRLGWCMRISVPPQVVVLGALGLLGYLLFILVSLLIPPHSAVKSDPPNRGWWVVFGIGTVAVVSMGAVVAICAVGGSCWTEMEAKGFYRVRRMFQVESERTTVFERDRDDMEETSHKVGAAVAGVCLVPILLLGFLLGFLLKNTFSGPVVLLSVLVPSMVFATFELVFCSGRYCWLLLRPSQPAESFQKEVRKRIFSQILGIRGLAYMLLFFFSPSVVMLALVADGLATIHIAIILSPIYLFLILSAIGLIILVVYAAVCSCRSGGENWEDFVPIIGFSVAGIVVIVVFASSMVVVSLQVSGVIRASSVCFGLLPVFLFVLVVIIVVLIVLPACFSLPCCPLHPKK